MAFQVRPARPEDADLIRPWTTNTFDWGDYLPERLPGWIQSPDSEVFVSVDEGDVPVAVVHALMLSDREGWLEAARVHPDHRRSGLGSALNEAGIEWLTSQGARVARLAVEEHNRIARDQVEAAGYRSTSSWVHAQFDTGEAGAASGPELHPAPATEVDAAWMSWSPSDLAYRGRGLIALGWRWRRATPEDLATAALEGRLFQSVAGWAIAEMREEDRMRTLWLATNPEDALSLVQGLVRLAASSGAAELTVKTPNLGWMNEALVRAGGTPREVLVYSLAL